MFNQSIVFEQPVNELIRVCLRLEYLLTIAQQGLKGQHISDTRHTISALIDLLILTDRPDLRGKFTKELSRQRANFQRYCNEIHIDQTKLGLTLEEVEKFIQLLHLQTGKFGASLRDNEFLTHIRQHLSSAGSALSFDTPAYYYWLQKNTLQERHHQIINWLNELEDLCQIVQFILRLTRQSGHPALHLAPEGFFQTSLDPQLPCQLIRVAVPHTQTVFPEIIVGRHGVGVRFYYPTIEERPIAYEKEVSFYLSCCIL